MAVQHNGSVSSISPPRYGFKPAFISGHFFAHFLSFLYSITPSVRYAHFWARENYDIQLATQAVAANCLY